MMNLEIYISKISKISSKKSIQEFYAKNIESINFYNNQFLSETSKKIKLYIKVLDFIYSIKTIFLIDQTISKIGLKKLKKN